MATGLPYTPAEIDRLLEAVVHADDDRAFDRALSAWYLSTGRSSAKNYYQAAYNLVKRLCQLRKELRYQGPHTSNSRTNRIGKPATYGERRLVKWAFTDPKGKASEYWHKPTPEYVAVILCRTVEEVSQIKREEFPEGLPV